MITHFQFEGNRLKEIQPWLIDGYDWAVFELDPDSTPKRLTISSEGIGKDGNFVHRTERWAYDLDGDTLRLCWPNPNGDYPDSICDQIYGVLTLTRCFGTVPELTRRTPDRKPIQDPIVGRLIWDSDLSCWETNVEVRAHKIVRIHISTENHEDQQRVVAIARELVQWLRNHENSAREFAASQLLDTLNGGWNEGEPISEQAFVETLYLQSVSIQEELGAELTYNAGDLFYGHWVVVRTANNFELMNAHIAG